MSIKKEMEKSAGMLSVLSRKPPQPELFGGGVYDATKGLEQQARAEAESEALKKYFLAEAMGYFRPSEAWCPIEPRIVAQRQMLKNAVVNGHGEEIVSGYLGSLVKSFVTATAYITREDFDNIAHEIGLS